MPLEYRTIRGRRPLWELDRLRSVHPRRRRTVPSCSDGVKSADSTVRQRATPWLEGKEGEVSSIV